VEEEQDDQVEACQIEEEDQVVDNQNEEVQVERRFGLSSG